MKLTRFSVFAVAAAVLVAPLATAQERPAKPNWDTMTLEQIKAHSAERNAKGKERMAAHHAEKTAHMDKCNAAIQGAVTKEAALAAKKQCKEEMKAKHEAKKEKMKDWKGKKGDKPAAR